MGTHLTRILGSSPSPIFHTAEHTSTLQCGDGGHKEHCWGLAAAVFMANCEIYVKLKFVEQKQIQGMPALSVCARSKARDSDLCMWIYFLSASWKVYIFVRLVVMLGPGRDCGGGGGGLVNVLFWGRRGQELCKSNSLSSCQWIKQYYKPFYLNWPQLGGCCKCPEPPPLHCSCV